MGQTVRILALGDNHGDSESLEQVVNEIDDESFDYVVHTGDFTNLFFDGYSKAQEQLDEMEPHLDSLAGKGEFVYVFGNRDSRGLDSINDRDLPEGTKVPEEGVAEIDDVGFTQESIPSDTVNKPVVRITHYWEATPPRFDGLLSLSGDTHNGRFINNIVDTSFLYRTSDHGADERYGGYFVIEADTENGIDVDFHSLGDVEERICRQHSLLGESFIVPKNWQSQCRYCYEEDEYYQELELAVKTAYSEKTGRSVDSDLTDDMVSTVENEFPRSFRREERARITSEKDDAQQTGLDSF